jgi:asparagine synthase (glutamine-hydrolysing)
MCGISGIIAKNKVDVRIEEMLERIKHRGPDGLFYWNNEDIAFGHARLRILDLSSLANQPMVDPATGNVIVFNGEIYNYKEIKKAIGKKYDFKTTSDTEVILAAYHIYGISFLGQLQGMFAFALFDKQKNKVLCVRDRFGIKPFYYRMISGAFLFASEIKALINLTPGKETINSLKVYEFLADRQLDTNEETFFEGVTQLLPAHYFWVTATGQQEELHRYWDYPMNGDRLLDEKSKKEFVDLFQQTINLHLRSDVAVGSFLSGGIDSSSVSCFAAINQSQQQLDTFSAVLPYHHSENALIKDVLAANDKMVSHPFLLDGKTFFKDIQKVIYHHDEPVLDGSMFAHYKLCQLAKDKRIKVLLSGSGGDELFGGYESHINSHHASLLSTFRFKKYLNDVKKVAANSDHSYQRLILRSFGELMPYSGKRALKNRQVRSRAGYLEITPEIAHYHFEHENRYYANLINYYKSWTVPPYLHYEDRNSMAFGVEARVPFYDHKLLEFVFQFDPDQIINGSSKSMLRTSFKGIVPDTVLNQKGKYGFPSPIDHALREDSIGKSLFFDLYRDTPFLISNKAEKVGRDFYAGKRNLTAYWRLLSYILWYHIFFTKTVNV